MKVPQFEVVPGPEPARFTDPPPPDRKRGPGDFARDERTAEKARAAQEALGKELRSKQAAPVPGEFRPEDFPDHRFPGALEVIELSGGPADGRTVNVQRGARSYTATCANPDPSGNAYIPASYARAKKVSSTGRIIFDFQKSAPVAV